MISIIIPAYNSAAFIERSLYSIQTQIFSDYEVLVVDDGSKDHTREIVEKWAGSDQRFRYFYKENGGVASARNFGLDVAVGDYVTFLDSDDTYEPDFLNEMYREITAAGKKMCYCGCIYCAGRKVIVKSPEIFNIQDPLTFIIQDHWISTDSWLICRSYLEQYHFRFSEQLKVGEDFDFFGRLLYWNTGSCAVVKKYLTNYNLRIESLSDKGKVWYTQAYILQTIEAYKSFCKVVGEHREISSTDYQQLMFAKIKRFYLRCLWGTLLLGTKEDFEVLYRNYQEDYAEYHLDLPLEKLRFRIWETIISHRLFRIVGKIFFSPYKKWQRRMEVSRIR